jgi:hypothetical protein
VEESDSQFFRLFRVSNTCNCLRFPEISGDCLHLWSWIETHTHDSDLSHATELSSNVLCWKPERPIAGAPLRRKTSNRYTSRIRRTAELLNMEGDHVWIEANSLTCLSTGIESMAWRNTNVVKLWCLLSYFRDSPVCSLMVSTRPCTMCSLKPNLGGIERRPSFTIPQTWWQQARSSTCSIRHRMYLYTR